MTIKVLELHHHAIRVGPTQAEVDAVRDFYVDVLGLAPDPGRSVRSKIPGCWLDVGDQAQVHLMGVTGVGADLGDGFDASAPHVALAVADVAAARAELERRGVPHRALQRATGPDSTQIFLKDPAGNLVELHQVGACRCVARTRAATDPAAGYTRVQGAVMFADMRGFTSMAERLKPGDTLEILNEYFSLLTEIAFRHDGTIFNMSGDSLMIGYGVPEPRMDGTARAIDTATEMLRGFRQLAFDWHARHRINVGLGIGINDGEVLAGDVGSPQYMSYTMIGDTVNVAARLSQRARAGEMLFSGSVKRALDERGYEISAVALPPLMLRGRSTPLDIFCVPLNERQLVDG